MERKGQLSIGILILFHLVGVMGIAYSHIEWFPALTPMNLLLGFALVMVNHPQSSHSFLRYVALVAFTGYMLEVAGVASGKIFGVYWYGENLGWKVMEVPLVIGINWIVLVLGSASLADYLPTKPLVKATVAAALMVTLDYWIEPIAIKLDYWNWEGGHIPLQNFLAWFAAAWLFQFVYFRMDQPKRNKTASALFIIQTVFFITLGMLM